MQAEQRVEQQDAGSALIVIERETALDVYTEPGGIEPYLQRIAAEVRGFSADVNTARGREAIRSLAYRVTRSKTYLDDLGKKLADQAKDIPKKIDANRRLAREYLDNLAADVRKPLTEWEAEKARIEAEEKARADAEALAEKVAHDHEVALLMNAEFDRAREAQKAADEAAAKDRERLAREDGERRAREAAERQIIEAKLAAERAERERAEAQERAEREASEKAERARAEAIEQERRRVEEGRRKAAEEQARRDADIQHRKAVNHEALAVIVTLGGITEGQGKAIVTAIILGHVPHVKITY